MKTLILGDLHGNTLWENICKKESPDRLICIGDYFDSYDGSAPQQLYNLKNLINYTDSVGIETILLIGNHDFHYMSGISENYSGYQPAYRLMIQNFFSEEYHRFTMCYSFRNFLFTHAGVSNIWLNHWMTEIGLQYEEDLDIVTFINDLWNYKPYAFCFTGLDPYGDSITSSPIWIRPRSLQNANKRTKLKEKYIQIVGHTQQKKIDTIGYTTGGRYFYIDTLGTSREYALIDDQGLYFSAWDENPNTIREKIKTDIRDYERDRINQPRVEWTEKDLKSLRF